MGVCGRVMLLSESTFAIPCHMTDLNRYRREASSHIIEIYGSVGSVLLGHGILNMGHVCAIYGSMGHVCTIFGSVTHPASDETRPHCSYPLIFPLFFFAVLLFCRGGL